MPDSKKHLASQSHQRHNTPNPNHEKRSSEQAAIVVPCLVKKGSLTKFFPPNLYFQISDGQTPKEKEISGFVYLAVGQAAKSSFLPVSALTICYLTKSKAPSFSHSGCGEWSEAMAEERKSGCSARKNIPLRRLAGRYRPHEHINRSQVRQTKLDKGAVFCACLNGNTWWPGRRPG